MGTVLGFLITIIALGIYCLRPHFLFLFWMMTWPLLCPLFCLFGGLYDVESANSFLYIVPEFFSYAYLLIFLLQIGRKGKKILKAKRLLISFVVLSFFFLIHSCVTHFDAQSIYLNIKSIIYLLLPMFVMIMDEKTRPNPKQLYIVALFILIIETFFVFLNYSGIRAYIAWYQAVIEFPEGATLATGTFLGSPRLADYTATLFCFFSVDFFSRRKIPGWQYLFIVFLCVICMLASGIRTPLAVSVIVVGLTVFLYGKQYRLLLIVLLLVGYSGLSWLGTYQGGELTNNDGVNRVVEGLTSFTQSKKDKVDDRSTLRLSGKLLDEYFYRAPILGNGRASLGHGAYPIADHVSDVSDFKADARLAFMLVEYGLVGFFLYFLLYSNIFKYFSNRLIVKDKRRSIIIFTYFVILSLTGSGLWDQNLFPYTYLYFSILGNKCSL